MPAIRIDFDRGPQSSLSLSGECRVTRQLTGRRCGACQGAQPPAAGGLDCAPETARPRTQLQGADFQWGSTGGSRTARLAKAESDVGRRGPGGAARSHGRRRRMGQGSWPLSPRLGSTSLDSRSTEPDGPSEAVREALFSPPETRGGEIRASGYEDRAEPEAKLVDRRLERVRFRWTRDLELASDALRQSAGQFGADDRGLLSIVFLAGRRRSGGRDRDVVAVG